MKTQLSKGLMIASLSLGLAANAQDKKQPNILVIMVDDVAPNSLSCYSLGMQYPTPNIDRIAKEGVLFTDHYSQPSCTAGRAAFITGQVPVRTGLTTVGQPGNPLGLKKEDIGRIAETAWLYDRTIRQKPLGRP